jgi:hypothetical protein
MLRQGGGVQGQGREGLWVARVDGAGGVLRHAVRRGGGGQALRARTCIAAGDNRLLRRLSREPEPGAAPAEGVAAAGGPSGRTPLLCGVCATPCGTRGRGAHTGPAAVWQP